MCLAAQPAVNADLPVNSVEELIAYARARPEELSYGSSCVGSVFQMLGELFNQTAGVRLKPVPYRGDAPLNAALIAGEIEVAVVPMATARPHIEGGRLRALAVTAAQRSSALPDVPTLMEQGVAVDSSSWNALFAPAQTPAETVATIQRETRKALEAAEVRERISGFGAEPVGSTPQEFAAFFKAEVDRYAQVIKSANIRAD